MPRPEEHKRRIKLILPRLQLRLTLALLGFAVLGFCVQFLLVLSGLPELASRLPSDSQPMLEGMQRLLLDSLVVSVLVFAPILTWGGVLTTFRIAGPIYRFQTFLGEVARGERPADCKIRKKDQLHELCELLNEATAPLRLPGEDTSSGGNMDLDQSVEGEFSKAS